MNGLRAALRRALARDERPLAAVPVALRLALLLALAAQLLWHALRPDPVARVSELPPAPPGALLRVLALGESTAAARAGLLWLQSFDDPPGVTVPLAQLDYERLASWLTLFLELDPRGQGPLLAASHVYTSVPSESRQRRMLALVHEQFLQDPARRWRWMAHAALLARHRLRDMPLALDYARALREHTPAQSLPGWARDLEVLLLEDICELEAARVLVGGLLASGSIADPAELAFLERKLAELESAEGCPPRPRAPQPGWR